MGPLAVRTEYQGTGLGKEIVTRGIEWLKQSRAAVIGLETMPRTMDNIGFYSRLGFTPGRLTLTTTLDATLDDRPATLLARRSTQEKEATLAECKALLERLAPGYDYTREIQLTDELSLGDTVILRGDDARGAARAQARAPPRGAVRRDGAVALRFRAAERDAARCLTSAGRVSNDLSAARPNGGARAVD